MTYAEELDFSERIKRLMTAAGVKVKSVSVSGRQIVITLRCEEQARKCVGIAKKAFKVRGILKTRDYKANDSDRSFLRTTVRVWKVYATVLPTK